MNQYIKDLDFFTKKRYFIFFLVLLSVISYGFSITHPMVHIDTLSADYYVGEGQAMLKSGRFGMTFWSWILGYGANLVSHHFIIGLLSAVMLIWAGINYCILLRRASQDSISDYAYAVFCGFLITHPIMSEIWEYQGANLCICGGYLLVSFAILVIYDQFSLERFCLKNFLFAVFCMTIVCTAYESLAAVYIFFVCAVLFVQQIRYPNWKENLRQGIFYSFVLVAAIICRVVITKIILEILNSSPLRVGETSIIWLTTPSILDSLKTLFYQILKQHFLVGLYSYPVGISIICVVGLAIYGIVLIFRKNGFAGLLALGMAASVELLSLLQGEPSPYRTCQVFPVICAFVGLLIVNCIRWKKILAIALCFLCLRQGIYLSSVQTLNYLRYEEEMNVINTIGTELERKYDLDKEVIFVGNYSLSRYISEQIPYGSYRGMRLHSLICSWISPMHPSYSEITHIPPVGVKSVINWAMVAFDSQRCMEDLFYYQGYKIQTAPDYTKIKNEMNDYTRENQIPAYPRDGYIMELGDRILVNMGE